MARRTLRILSCTRFLSWLSTAVFAVMLMAGAASAHDKNYVDVSAYGQLSSADYEAWIALKIALDRNFDDICGDTFCEGEFSNIESLRFRCSVEESSGRIGMCVWMFAASNEEINPATGGINVSQRGFWRCKAPLEQGATIEQLNSGAARRRAAVRTATLHEQEFDGWAECLLVGRVASGRQGRER